MSRMLLYLARTLEPPPVDAWIEVYGIGSSGSMRARVVDVDAAGITVELESGVHGALIWHIDLPQVQ